MSSSLATAVAAGKVGNGLRSSVAGIKAAVFGSRGKVGTFTASELGGFPFSLTCAYAV
jgi:hypothetical protein